MTGERWPAYAWSFPIGDGRANVGYGEVLRGAPVPRTRCCSGSASCCPASSPHRKHFDHRLPLSSSRPKVVDGPVILAGDALSLQPDDRGGHLLRRPVRRARRRGLLAQGAGQRYRQLLRRRLHGHLGTRRWCPGSAVGRVLSTVGCSVLSGISRCSTISSSSDSAMAGSRFGSTASAVGIVARRVR